jgi:salicylate hydroxylase
MHPKVAVIGGGIGGLGAALSLFRAGFDVHVFEQARALPHFSSAAGMTAAPW